MIDNYKIWEKEKWLQKTREEVSRLKKPKTHSLTKKLSGLKKWDSQDLFNLVLI